MITKSHKIIAITALAWGIILSSSAQAQTTVCKRLPDGTIVCTTNSLKGF